MIKTDRQEALVSISVVERAAVEAYLDKLALDIRNLAERLEQVKTGLRGPVSTTREFGQQVAGRLDAS